MKPAAPVTSAWATGPDLRTAPEGRLRKWDRVSAALTFDQCARLAVLGMVLEPAFEVAQGALALSLLVQHRVRGDVGVEVLAIELDGAIQLTQRAIVLPAEHQRDAQIVVGLGVAGGALGQSLEQPHRARGVLGLQGEGA